MNPLKKFALFLLVALSGCNPAPRTPDMSTAQKLKGVPVPGPIASGGYDTITDNTFTPLTKQKKIYPTNGLNAANDTNGTDILIDPAYSNTWTTNQTIFRSFIGANLQSFGVSLVAATPATNVLAQFSPSLDLACNYWTGAASASASWMVGAAGDSTTGGRFLIQKNNASPADAFSIDYSTLSTKVYGPLTFSDNTQQGTAMASVSGQTGKYLTNNGSTTSWASVTGQDYYPYPLKNYVDNTALVVDSVGAGSQTSGSVFAITQSATVSGCRCRWPATHVGDTLRIKLWDLSNSVALQSKDITAVSGWNVTTFTSTTTLTPYKPYSCSAWETTGARYTFFNMHGGYLGGFNSDIWNGAQSPVTTSNIGGVLTGPYFEWISWAAWTTGDAKPSGIATTERYPCEPIFTIP